MTEQNLTEITGIVKPGHQGASGNTPNSPYEQGTLAIQQPFFLDLGLDYQVHDLPKITLACY